MIAGQSAFGERFDWGADGLRSLAPHADVIVVVDVLSFATAVEIAVGRGALVYPIGERGAPAAALARRVDGLLAGDRPEGRPAVSYSLSPASLLTIPPHTRLVLPSPNGAALVTLAAGWVEHVLVGCLRNASAVAACCQTLSETVAVIAAGERWRYDPDGGGRMRPAVEDLVGAGAILAALAPRHPSPEAVAAMAAFRAAADDLEGFIAACTSGKELIARGFRADVTLAAQHDVSQTVPWLRGNVLTAWTAEPR